MIYFYFTRVRTLYSHVDDQLGSNHFFCRLIPVQVCTSQVCIFYIIKIRHEIYKMLLVNIDTCRSLECFKSANV